MLTPDDITWADVPARMDEWVLACAEPGAAVKAAAANVPTAKSHGYYLHPATGLLAVYSPVGGSDPDFLRCKAAACRALGRDSVGDTPLPDCEVATGRWVKVAYSPTVRAAGEVLNFFPGTHTGIPNAPSPLAAMLTTALVGGGLGYGAGRLAEGVLPLQKGKARKSLGVGGALAGAALAAPWALANMETDGLKGLVSPKPLDGGPTPVGDTANYSGFSPADVAKAVKRGADLDSLPLGAAYRAAVDAFVKVAEGAGTFGNFAPRLPATALDVNIDAMGRTLWDTGASPALAASTMSALYAAQQMPDPNSRPGLATGHQLGQLAVNAGKDYVTGALVGAALNKTLGLPVTANQAGMGNLVLGLIGAAVPKLFG